MKARLDRIDARTKLKGASKVGDLWRLEKLGMWHKGLEVLREYPELASGKLARGGRGGRAGFREVGRLVARKHTTVKRWVDLVKHVGKTRTQFDRWAKMAVPEVVSRWTKGLPAKGDWQKRELQG